MPVTAVVGANWGDEGKGKLTDYLAAEADYVVRFQGGNNAGHTIINEFGKFALHLLPSGVFHKHVVNVLASAVAINIPALLKELAMLKERGVDNFQLKISNRAQIVLPYHIAFDHLEEERRGAVRFGSTKSGMAPFYSDLYAKVGIQIHELFHRETLKQRLEQILPLKNLIHREFYKQKNDWGLEELLTQLEDWACLIKPFVCDTTQLLRQALYENKKILLEGQLGALRDPVQGIYPYTTSSSTLAGFAASALAIPASSISEVVAVTKSYSSCVGAGPMVGELLGSEAEELRRRGGDAGEYGATTGRPRRMGWFDCVASRYGIELQGATSVGLTNLDVLGYLKRIPVCYAYRIRGKETTHFPVTQELIHAEPVYKEMEGWLSPITQLSSFDQLPKAAQAYVRFIEESLQCPIVWLSYGPERWQTLKLAA